jgi:hypothetical protein
MTNGSTPTPSTAPSVDVPITLEELQDPARKAEIVRKAKQRHPGMRIALVQHVKVEEQIGVLDDATNDANALPSTVHLPACVPFVVDLRTNAVFLDGERISGLQPQNVGVLFSLAWHAPNLRSPVDIDNHLRQLNWQLTRADGAPAATKLKERIVKHLNAWAGSDPSKRGAVDALLPKPVGGRLRVALSADDVLAVAPDGTMSQRLHFVTGARLKADDATAITIGGRVEPAPAVPVGRHRRR